MIAARRDRVGHGSAVSGQYAVLLAFLSTIADGDHQIIVWFPVAGARVRIRASDDLFDDEIRHFGEELARFCACLFEHLGGLCLRRQLRCHGIPLAASGFFECPL